MIHASCDMPQASGTMSRLLAGPSQTGAYVPLGVPLQPTDVPPFLLQELFMVIQGYEAVAKDAACRRPHAPTTFREAWSRR